MKNLFYSLQENIQKLTTQKNLLYFSALPLFVNWYLILLFYYENPIVKKQCFRSALLNFVFFFLLFLSWILSKIPLLGPLLGNLIHLIAIIIYVGVSFFLIYKIYTDQKLDIELLDKYAKNLEHILS